MINIDVELLDKAIDKWGIDAQLLMLQEECMEIAMAIHKYYTRDNSENNLEKIYDELADVLIISEQAKRIFEEDKIQSRIDFKMNRLEQRLSEMDNCTHKNAYYFHDNAPAFCPDCKKYVDGVYNN